MYVVRDWVEWNVSNLSFGDWLVRHVGVVIVGSCFLVDGGNVVKLRLHILAWRSQHFVLYSPTLR